MTNPSILGNNGKTVPLSKEMLSRHNNPCFFQCTEVYNNFLLLICCKNTDVPSYQNLTENRG